MKKRNEEGYVLVYVMVVVFVLCAIATTLITQTIHTMAAQKNMVDRMQDKYAAMGEIEKLVADLEDKCESLRAENLSCGSEENALKEAKVNFINFVKTEIAQLDSSDEWELSSIQFVDPRDPQDISYEDILSHDYHIHVERISPNTTVCVTTDILLNCSDHAFSASTQEFKTERDEYKEWLANGGTLSGDPEPPQYDYTYSYTVTDVTFDFISYEIASTGGDPA